MNTWVIIPGYNESRYLKRLLKKVSDVTAKIIFVDDGSTDNSADIARQHVRHVLRHRVNLGKGAAMATGATYAFQELDADAVVFLDADDQHDPKELTQFFQAFKQGAQLVLGARNMSPSMPLTKIMGNRLASFLMLMLFGTYVPDIPSGYRGFAKSLWPKLRWNSSGYEVEAEIAMNIARHKLPFSVVPIEVIYHDHDKGMTTLDALHIALCLLKWRIGI